MDRMIAYCGLVCSDCPAYVATQADDRAALEKVAAQWREEYNHPDATAESVICDGCLATSGRLGCYGPGCEVRACAVGRGVVSCGHCADYACDKLENLFKLAPDARPVLDEVRRSASSSQ